MPAVRVGFRRTLVKAQDAVHSLRFDRSAFPTKRMVRSWLPLHGFRLSSITETPDAWVVRCGSGEPGDVQQAGPGVEAVMVIPMTGKVVTAISASSVAHNGATGPSNHTPELPDFESIYAQPEAQARQAQEAKQSEARRRSTWLDLNFNGLHGNPGPDRPELKYIGGKSSTGDAAITQPRIGLSPKGLKAARARIQRGPGMGYDVTQAGKKR